MPPRSSRSEAVLADLLTCAIELIRVGGIESVTVRALAQKSFYAPSTIGYHTAPFDQFVGRVWRKVGIDLAADVLSDPECDDWSPPAARRMLGWSDREPRLAEFFVAHAATPPEAYDTGEWSFLDGMSDELPGDRTMAVLTYLARRFQLALEHALRWPSEREGQEAVLAAELEAIDAEWRRFVDSTRPTVDGATSEGDSEDGSGS